MAQHVLIIEFTGYSAGQDNPYLIPEFRGGFGQNPEATAGKGDTECTFEVHQPADEAVVIRILENDETPVSVLFIGGDGNATAVLPEGMYGIRYAWGQDWYGLEKLITSGVFLQMTFGEDNNSLVRFESGQDYSITLNME